MSLPFDFDIEQSFASGVPETVSRNSLLVDIWFKSRSSYGQKLDWTGLHGACGIPTDDETSAYLRQTFSTRMLVSLMVDEDEVCRGQQVPTTEVEVHSLPETEGVGGNHLRKFYLDRVDMFSPYRHWNRICHQLSRPLFGKNLNCLILIVVCHKMA